MFNSPTVAPSSSRSSCYSVSLIVFRLTQTDSVPGIPWLYGYVEHWKNPICEGSWAALYILGLFLSAPPIMIYISRWRPLLLVSGHMQRKSDLWCGTLITAFALMHLAAYFRIVRRMGEASCWGELMILVTRFPASVVFASGFYASDNPYVLYLLQ